MSEAATGSPKTPLPGRVQPSKAQAIRQATIKTAFDQQKRDGRPKAPLPGRVQPSKGFLKKIKRVLDFQTTRTCLILSCIEALVDVEAVLGIPNPLPDDALDLGTIGYRFSHDQQFFSVVRKHLLLRYARIHVTEWLLVCEDLLLIYNLLVLADGWRPLWPLWGLFRKWLRSVRKIMRTVLVSNLADYTYSFGTHHQRHGFLFA